MTSQYNIDALRNKDGNYRRAGANFIKGALECGHTAHLQTGRGTVAFRPYKIDEVRVRKDGTQYFPGEKVGQNWLVEFYPTGHNPGDEIRLYSNNKIDLIRFAYGHLNGEQKACASSGDATSTWSNQANREADVLAVIGEEVLIEYEMPGTTNGRETSSLRVIKQIGILEYGAYKSYSYRNLPKRWINAMHEQGTEDWIGMGQTESEPVPFPNKRG